MKNIILLFVGMLLTNITFSQTNLALNGTATASSESQAASNAIDGNLGTRWESGFTDNEVWTIDLGNTYTIDNVISFTILESSYKQDVQWRSQMNVGLLLYPVKWTVNN